MPAPHQRRSLLLPLLAAAVLMTGCTRSDAHGADAQPAGAKAAPGAAVAAATPAPKPELEVDPDPVFDTPLTIRVSGANFAEVSVTQEPDAGATPSAAGADSATALVDLPGEVDAAGAWVSTALPIPGATYDVVATVTGAADETQLRGTVTVSDVPDSRRLTLTVLPNAGSTVGVGQPVIVRFDQSLSDAGKAAFEGRAVVAASKEVLGAWHWVSDREVHFRPKTFWPAHTTVEVRLDLNGVQASDDRWGGRSYTTRFTVGAAQVSTVDGKKHTMTVRVDGKARAVWSTSLGKPEFETRSGTYTVLDTEATRRMTSCNANITCTKGEPNYYDLTVKWDVRLTWSGTFVHAAPWSSSSQGRSNVSHGCVNLSDAHGQAFYRMSRPGDVVVVENTSRTAADLVAKGDPGMADWNTGWKAYVAKSALGRSVSTVALS